MSTNRIGLYPNITIRRVNLYYLVWRSLVEIFFDIANKTIYRDDRIADFLNRQVELKNFLKTHASRAPFIIVSPRAGDIVVDIYFDTDPKDSSRPRWMLLGGERYYFGYNADGYFKSSSKHSPNPGNSKWIAKIIYWTGDDHKNFFINP